MGSKKNIIKSLNDIADNVEYNKERFLYSYSRQIVDDEIAINVHLESKAIRLTNFLSLVITAFIAFFSYIFNNLKDSTLLGGSFYVYCFLTAVLLMLAWCYFFNAVKISSTERLKLDDSILQHFNNEGNSINRIYCSLSKDCVNVVKSLSSVNTKKSKSLEIGYCMVFASAISFSVALMIFFLSSIG